MRKIHSRTKRKFRLNTHRNAYHYFHLVKRERPKTFTSVEAAHKHASEHGLKTGQYELASVKQGKKYKIVLSENKSAKKR